MLAQRWTNEAVKTVVCADSYDKGVLTGRVYVPGHGIASFDSLSEFILHIEALVGRAHEAAGTTVAELLHQGDEYAAAGLCHRGRLATFELQILFHQHNSWQGILNWPGKKPEQPFRSVLELIELLDSMLRQA